MGLDNYRKKQKENKKSSLIPSPRDSLPWHKSFFPFFSPSIIIKTAPLISFPGSDNHTCLIWSWKQKFSR